MRAHGRRLTRWAMFAFGALVVAVASAMLLGKGGRVPMSAAFAVLAFGASLMVVSWAQLTQGRTGPSTEPRPDGHGVVTIGYARRYEVALSLASLLLAVGGVGMVVGASAWDDPGLVRVIGAVAAVFFGAVAIVRARSLRRPRQVRLRPDSLDWDGPLAGRIAWQDVADVARYETLGNPLLGIALHPGRTIQGTTSAIASMLPSLGRDMTGFDVSIPLDGLRCDPEVLERLVRSYALRAGGSTTRSP